MRQSSPRLLALLTADGEERFRPPFAQEQACTAANGGETGMAVFSLGGAIVNP